MAACIACIALLIVDPISVPVPWADLLTAIAAASVMIYCTRQLTSATAKPSLMLRILNARPLILLGPFSYSLYLTHSPVVAAADWFTRSEHLSRFARASVVLLPGTVVCLAVAYVFFLFFERPFLQTSARRAPQRRCRLLLRPSVAVELARGRAPHGMIRSILLHQLDLILSDRGGKSTHVVAPFVTVH